MATVIHCVNEYFLIKSFYFLRIFFCPFCVVAHLAGLLVLYNFRRSKDGGTPLFVACQGGHENMVSELLSYGANVHACMKVSIYN